MERFKPKFAEPTASKDFFNLTNSSECSAPDAELSSFVYNQYHSLSLENQRKRLPIHKHREHILYLLQTHRCLVLVGDTGCGKSTQIPQYIVETEWTKDGSQVAITEPRRIAAVTLANRVADEMGVVVGQNVGYAIQFDDCTSAKTDIKYMTEGVMVKELMSDPLLKKYCVIMLDEVHERTIHTDILMGLIKKVLKKRRDLKLIVASATVDAEEIRDFFNLNSTKNPSKNSAVILSVQGHSAPVDVYFLHEPIPDYLKGTVVTVIKIHENQPNGDILAFLTGQDEVTYVVDLLNEHAKKYENTANKLLVLPMYGSLPHVTQLKVFRHTPDGYRKVVVATNIAETSITILGIVYVIDCGFVKLRWYDPETRTDSLVTIPVSKASADQRSGRAGRVRPGKAFRLYTETDWDKLRTSNPPEIQRTNLLATVLKLKALGIDNLVRFDFPTPPPAKNLASALELLYALDAIDDNCALTKPLGVTMAEFFLHPLIAKMLIMSGEFKCSEEILSIAAMLQVDNVYTHPHGEQMAMRARVMKRLFEVEQGDLLTLLNVFQGFVESDMSREFCQRHFFNYKTLKRVCQLREQLVKLMRRYHIPIVSAKGNTQIVLKCITAAYFPNAAYLHHSGSYKSVRGDVDLAIDPTSLYYTIKQPQWVLFVETVHTTKTFMRHVTAIERDWLVELAPHYYKTTSANIF